MFWMIWYIKKDDFSFNHRLTSQNELSGVFNRLSWGCAELVSNLGRHIQYAYTTVFSLSGNKVKINTGGFYTVTTKKWINEGLSEFWASIFQKDFVWYIMQNNWSVTDFNNWNYTIDRHNILKFNW